MKQENKQIIIKTAPLLKTLIVVFGGLIVMPASVIGGVWIALALPLDNGNYMFLVHILYGAVIGLIVGVTICAWLGYMVYRDKNAAPNEVILDDSTT